MFVLSPMELGTMVVPGYCELFVQPCACTPAANALSAKAASAVLKGKVGFIKGLFVSLGEGKVSGLPITAFPVLKKAVQINALFLVGQRGAIDLPHIATLHDFMRKMPAMRTLYLSLACVCLILSKASPAHGRSLKPQSVADGSVRSEGVTRSSDLLISQLRQLRERLEKAGSLDSALQTSLRITAIDAHSNDRAAMADDWLATARISRLAGNLEGAIASAKKAVLIQKTTGNQSQVTASTLALLDLLLEAGKWVEFKHLSTEALSFCQRSGDRSGLANVLYRQGECLGKQGRWGDALPLLHQAIGEAPADLTPHDAAMMQFALARAYAGMGQWGLARMAYNNGLGKFPGAPASFNALYGLDAMIYEGMGDLHNALRLERKQATAKDSSLNASLAERLATIRMMYEVDSMETHVSLLNAANKEMQARLKGRGTMLYLLSGLAVLLAAGLAFFILLRSKQSRFLQRSRMRNTLLAGHAREMQAKSLNLERRNLQLSHALMEEPGRHRPWDESPGAGTMQWMALALRAQLKQPCLPGVMQALGALQRRMETMELLEQHAAKTGATGLFNLKAHLASLTAMVIRENGLAGRMEAEFHATNGEMQPGDVLPLSLIIRELLAMSAAHAASSGRKALVRVALRDLGPQQCELLYTDESGGISRDSLHNGSLEAAMVHEVANAVGAGMVLLKGDFTTVQITFKLRQNTNFRKAS